MKVVNDAMGRGGAIVAFPSPVLGHHAADAVSQTVKRAVSFEHSVGDGIDKSAVNIVEIEILRIEYERYGTDGHKVAFLAGQRTLNLKEVGAGQVFGLGILYAPGKVD